MIVNTTICYCISIEKGSEIMCGPVEGSQSWTQEVEMSESDIDDAVKAVRARKRISEMEEIFDEVAAAQDSLERAVDNYKSLQDKVRKLEDYYSGDQWKEDFAMDEQGEIPADIKRGVLSEGGIYDLLERKSEIMRMIETGED